MLKKKFWGAFAATLLAIGMVAAPGAAEGALKPVRGTTPTIIGSFFGDGTLRVNTGTWTAGSKLSYKWRLDGAVIPKAISKTLLVTNNFVGHEIGVEVTGSKSGMKSTTLSSIDYPVGIIEVTSQPSVSGNLTLGGALSISECDCTPRIQSRQIQWFKDGVAIAGANSTSYILTSNDYGSVFTAQIVMQVPGYASVTATTAPTQKMLQPIQALSKPSITYSALATGSTFTIQGGSYSPSQVSLAYTWFADGQQIPNQSGSSFTPGSEFGGKLISAQIVASANGYSSVTLKTDAVGPLLTVKTYTTTKLNPMTYFSNCGGTGYHTCARDSLGLSDNTNGMSVYASYSYSDSVCAMFGANVQDVDPSKMIRWRITAKGWAGSGVDRPALMPSTSTSWFDTVTSQMTLLSNDGTVTTNWLTTPMGGSQGHGLYWGVYHSDWGHYYIDYFQIEIQYYG